MIPSMTPVQTGAYNKGYEVGYLKGAQDREQGVGYPPTEGLTPQQAGVPVPPFYDPATQSTLYALQKDFIEFFQKGWLAGWNHGYGGHDYSQAAKTGTTAEESAGYDAGYPYGQQEGIEASKYGMPMATSAKPPSAYGVSPHYSDKDYVQRWNQGWAKGWLAGFAAGYEGGVVFINLRPEITFQQQPSYSAEDLYFVPVDQAAVDNGCQLNSLKP